MDQHLYNTACVLEGYSICQQLLLHSSHDSIHTHGCCPRGFLTLCVTFLGEATQPLTPFSKVLYPKQLGMSLFGCT